MRFYVEGRPRPLPRPRFVRGRAVSIASKSVKMWRDRVEREARIAHAGAPPIREGVGAWITFHMPTRKRERWGKLHTIRPDRDNLEKLILDALKRAGVLADDCLVAYGGTFKLWSMRGGVDVILSSAIPIANDDEAGAVPDCLEPAPLELLAAA